MSRLNEELKRRYGRRVYNAPYDPVQRAFHPNVVLPDSLRDLAPHTVFQVASADEVVSVLTLAQELGEPIHVRQGSGQISIDLLSPFPPGSTIVDLRRLKHVTPRPEDGVVEVGPAATLGSTNEQLRSLGYEFPIAVEQITWGGLISVNLSGHLVDAAAGKPGDYVQGLEVVLPSGAIIHTGTSAMRKVVGPDLTRLFVGGQGLFGIITSATLRLVPAPGGKAWGTAGFDDLARLVDSARAIHTKDVAYPHVLELVDAEFVEASGLARIAGPGSLLLVATHGDNQQEADAKLQSILDYASSRHGARTTVLKSEDWDEVWRIRSMPHHQFDGEYLIGEVLDTPLSKLEQAVSAVADIRRELLAAWPGLTGYIIGHIGAGTMHPAYSCPADWSYEKRVKVVREIRSRVHELKVSLGSSIGEQGIFPEHARWYRERFGTESVWTIEALVRALDPNRVLNPGRMIPVDAPV